MNISIPLLQLITIIVCNFITQIISSSSSMDTLILPLKLQTVTKPSSKLSFHHNVTLTVTLTVGSPPQTVTMVLDTGSELSWLHCKKAQNINSVFNPLASSSYSPVPCSSSICRTQTRDFTIPVSCDPKKLCHAMLSYADASSIEGNLASETFNIGSSPRPRTIFGCMDSGFSSNSEEDSKTTGLIGMNRGSLSFVSQMGLAKFSYCISGRDSSGFILFGEASFAWLGPLKYTPLVKMSQPLPYYDRVAYTVQLLGIKVSNKLLQLSKSVFVPDHTGAGQTMVDSGTQFTFLLGPVYTALRNEFAQQTKSLAPLLKDQNFVFQGAMDLCYQIPPTRRSFSDFPAVTLIFQGAEMSVSGDKLLYRVPGMRKGSDSVYCFTFGNSDLLGIEAFVIGHHHQQNVWIEFDLAKSRVGLAEVRCDLASQRLGGLVVLLVLRGGTFDVVGMATGVLVAEEVVGVFVADVAAGVFDISIGLCIYQMISHCEHSNSSSSQYRPLTTLRIEDFENAVLPRIPDRITAMSFVFRGTRSDIESGFTGFVPERRPMRLHSARPVNSNSLAFLVTVLLLFMILNSHQMSPNFLLWLVLGVFLMATTLRMYATCQQLQAQAQAHAAAAGGLLGHTELRLHIPPSISLATRGRLQGLRLQLALLDREFDDLDYETLRALDADNAPTAHSMTEEEINALPVHKYKVADLQNSASSMQQASSSASAEKQGSNDAVGNAKASEDELTCSVCLEQVNVGEVLRSLPCLHQFHANCIDPWLRQQGTCPVCKFKAGSVWQESGEGEVDASFMV
ncbi:hypothetical protein G4B88_019942 [Cannabis sativa]|uniref:Uncharacterized protein n=1 Tax=Cannabis sativa TaxID=3483 RepID=A0A7J6E7N2_CANSA|nr:hypothetical protein G4B88_019942 [Cannabis sativa]